MEILLKLNIMARWEQGTPPQPCFGEMDLCRINERHRTAYIGWVLREQSGALIGRVYREFFVKEGPLEYSAFIKRALDDIATYRSGRRLVFSDVKIVEDSSKAGEV